MFTISGLVTAPRIVCGETTTSKKKSLQLISELLETAIEQTDEQGEMEVLNALAARERLGCTGMGHGIAIPHGRVDFVDEPIGAIVVLSTPIDFDAPDNQPVDIIFGLLMPQEKVDEHLNILASLAAFFNNPENRKSLRAAGNAQDIEIILRSQDTVQSTTQNTTKDDSDKS